MKNEKKWLDLGAYIGQKKIRNATLCERKTYTGKDVYEIEFEDGSKHEYSETILSQEGVVTPKPQDPEALTKAIISKPYQDLQMVCLECELDMEMIEYMANNLLNWPLMALNHYLELQLKGKVRVSNGIFNISIREVHERVRELAKDFDIMKFNGEQSYVQQPKGNKKSN